jgi:hypothetical protein
MAGAWHVSAHSQAMTRRTGSVASTSFIQRICANLIFLDVAACL